MGTVVSIDVRDAGIAETIVDAVVAHLHDGDARFGQYRPDSEVSRFGRGEVALDDASQDLRYVLTRCEQLRRESDGVFDVWRHRGDSRFDPSGYVKGWAVEEAALHLEAAGATAYAINAGGDVIARGGPEPGLLAGRYPPSRSCDALVAVLAVRDLASRPPALRARRHTMTRVMPSPTDWPA
jgi:thiamine biosynthesis lipoprotein